MASDIRVAEGSTCHREVCFIFYALSPDVWDQMLHS